jgi:predicted MFS family arabinose efflux permease
MVWFPRRQRATAIGLKQVGLPLGGAVGALVMPPLAMAFGWRWAVGLSAGAILAAAALTWMLYRDPPAQPAGPVAASGTAPPAGLGAVLGNRDLWLVSLATLAFAGVQTVFMGYLVLYLREAVGVPLMTAARYLTVAQIAGTSGRVAFGFLSDRFFGGRRRIVLALAGVGSASCALLLATTGPETSAWLLVPLAVGFGFFGIGWNGVQLTLMAELVTPRVAGTALGLGLAVSSMGVTICPPLFGLLVERSGGFGLPWAALGGSMVLALLLLLPVRERRLEPA